MMYRYGGKKDCPLRSVAEAEACATRGRLRVLILGKEQETEHFCAILAANVRSWGYEAVLVTAAMMRDPQMWQGLEGDILLYDLDVLLQSTEMGGKSGAELASSLGIDLVGLNKNWPRARLSIVLSAGSVSRSMLERLGAVALLHKPFDMRTLERYLRVFQRLLYAGTEPEEVHGLCRLTYGGMERVVSEGAGMEASAGQVARVLVADDQEDVTWGIRQCLVEQEDRRYHYEVREVHDGLALLEQCLIWKPHCVVTDVLMPWLNGYQVMRCMAKSVVQPRPVFVVISALMQYEFPVYGTYLQDQVVRYIEKPFDVEDLLATIEQELSRVIEPGFPGVPGL